MCVLSTQNINYIIILNIFTTFKLQTLDHAPLPEPASVTWYLLIFTFYIKFFYITQLYELISQVY